MAAFVAASGGGVVVDDFRPESVAAAVRGLLAAPERCREMADRGCWYVRENYSRARVSKMYAEALRG